MEKMAVRVFLVASDTYLIASVFMTNKTFEMGRNHFKSREPLNARLFIIIIFPTKILFYACEAAIKVCEYKYI